MTKTSTTDSDRQPRPRTAAAIARLASPDLPEESLAELSEMDRQEAGLFQQAWQALDVARRRDILGSLSRMANAEVGYDFAPVFRLALDDSDAEVRRLAIAALWECEATWLIHPLLQLLAADPDEAVRAEAARALGRFALRAELGELPAPEATAIAEALLAAASDPRGTTRLRGRALEAAAFLSIDPVRRAIDESYHSRDEQMVLSAITAMGLNCDPDWLPLLIRELANPAPEIRLATVNALGEMENEAAVTDLAELLYDEDRRVRLATITALARISGPEARECLVLCLDDPDEEISTAAEQALAQLARMDSLDIL